MPPDQGCYEERYRLTFPVARSAAVSLVSLIPAIDAGTGPNQSVEGPHQAGTVTTTGPPD